MIDEFKIEGLKFKAGGFGKSWKAAIKKAEADNLVERIWKRDHTLWNPKPKEISNRMGWLDIAARMRAEIPSLKGFADSVKGDGIDRVLLLGMGGSSLAPELFGEIFGNGSLALNVLDSTDPDAVLEQERIHDPTTTLYIVSSKSGGTVETISFFKYFYNQALSKLGSAEAGKHFVAITDPGSGLAKAGEQFGFRHIFLTDPNIGGRYSALSHFGLVPASLVGVDLDRLLSSAEKMAERCKEKRITKNPGAMLGLVLGALALQGRDKATFILPEEKASFGDWVEQLIAESTGKEGKGILPIVREPLLDDKAYSYDRVFITYGESDKSPQIELEWKSNYDIGAQLFLWELATAVAGYVLGLSPFDQPNVESAKVQSRLLVDDYLKSTKLPAGELEVLSWPAMDLFIKQKKPGDYIALQIYAAPSQKLTAAFEQLRGILGNLTRSAITLGYGPRFLHSTGQLHKGDSGNGLFMQFITLAPKDDLPVPAVAGKEASHLTFGVLKTAQALGDAQALRNAQRRVISFKVDGDMTSAVNRLIMEIPCIA